MISKITLYGIIFVNLLTEGGGMVNIFAISIDRGNLAFVEVVGNSPITSVPDRGVWKNGGSDSTSKCFDIFATGKCKSGSEKVKMKILPAPRIPDFFTKNSLGEIVLRNHKF